jgi:hypothetical protein
LETLSGPHHQLDMPLRMHLLHQYRFWAATALFLLLFAVLYPLYQFVFDPDAIGYMMITKRLAAGDYYNAINGMWSPLHSWMILPVKKMGINEITAFKWSNAAIAVVILVLVNNLLKKITLPDFLKTGVMFVCIPILLWYSYFQVAADILVCVPVLWYINLVSKDHFFQNRRANVLCGVIACFAYLSKSYFFPYFILHFSLVQFYFYRNHTGRAARELLMRNLFAGLGIFILLAGTWVATLYYRFHKLTIGFAGAYNHKLSLLPPAGKVILVPPLLPGSPDIWEDVSLANFGSYRLLGPVELFAKQIRVILYQFMEMLKNFNELSVFSLAIVLGLIIYLNRTKNQVLSVFLITLVTLPIGYLLMHIETRYIWVDVFLLLIAGAFLLQHVLQYSGTNRNTAFICWLCFFGSFLVYPVNGLKDTIGKDKEVFVLAEKVKQLNLKGRFASNDNRNVMGRMAYLSENASLPQYSKYYTQAEFLKELNEKQVNYYFFFYRHPAELENFKGQEIFKVFGEKAIQANPGLVILPITNR